MCIFAVIFSGCSGYFNDPPVIEEIAVSKMEVSPGEEVTVNIVANDPDGDELTYEYEVSGGHIRSESSSDRFISIRRRLRCRNIQRAIW